MRCALGAGHFHRHLSAPPPVISSISFDSAVNAPTSRGRLHLLANRHHHHHHHHNNNKARKRISFSLKTIPIMPQNTFRTLRTTSSLK
jgi:hypothetical protein